MKRKDLELILLLSFTVAFIILIVAAVGLQKEYNHVVDIYNQLSDKCLIWKP